MKSTFRSLLPVFALACALCFSCRQQSRKDDTKVLLVNEPSQFPDHIILTFSGDPSTSQSVSWRTDTSIRSAVAEIALADPAPQFWRTAQRVEAKTETVDAKDVLTAETIMNYHSATFANLLPDTMYAYRVGDGQRWSEWFQFRTARRGEAPFSFLYVGDAQNHVLDLWSRVIREGFRKAPQSSFIIHAGDLINNAHSEQQWDEWFRAGGWLHAMVPSVPTPGNHEYAARTKEEAESKVRHLSVQWRPQFTLPANGPEILRETAYFFDYQATRIVSLNSNIEYEIQAKWLDSVLSNNPNKWTILTFHHPIFSGAENRDNKLLRDTWKPVIDKHAVDLVLNGHDHTYARGWSKQGMEKNVNRGSNLREGGTVYVVSVSGAKMYDLQKELWKDYEAIADRGAENTQLFQVVSIAGDSLMYYSYTATGHLYDAFTLKKQAGKGNLFTEQTVDGAKTRTFQSTLPYED